MIISPPFLPEAALDSPLKDASDASDPMMDALDEFELWHGIYPIAFDRRWHCGMHLKPSNVNEPVRAIADGEVVAYRICLTAIGDGHKNRDGTADLNTNIGFVLLKHTTDTGDGRTLTFYSLYMHLLDLREQNRCVLQPNPDQQQPQSSPTALSAWLLKCSAGDERNGYAAQPGNGLKVRRKDVLGYRGACQGNPHLHFEIFMTKPDFEAYFGQTQLGREQIVTPTTTDHWGSTYYVIPPAQQFLPLPVGTGADHKLHGVAFKPLRAGKNIDTLYVEAWFHHGKKFTQVWRDAGGGRLELLTAQPITEHDYEYDLYQRATALYPDCPSDGYEMLRFGRILGKPEKLPTWIRVAFAAGQEGYIDISNKALLTLSDADFPFFKGWKKVSEGSGPFNADGMCDIDALKHLLKDTKDHLTRADFADVEGFPNEDVLVRYVKRTEGVREQLRGFVCEAPSEWDGSHNEDRFRKLKELGEFYDGNEAGYARFMKFLASMQFWEHTGLPAGEKLWFFHPLEFIRHFRKCGWRSLRELTQTLPRRSSGDAGGEIPWFEAEKRWSQGDTENGSMPPDMHIVMNHMWAKYGFFTSQRQAHFLAQVFKETTALQETVEKGAVPYFRIMYEVLTPEEAAHDFDHKHAWLQKMNFLKGRDRPTYVAQRPGEIRQKAEKLGNTHAGDGPRFCGRGLIHLTGRDSYAKYGRYRNVDFTTEPNPQLLSTDAVAVADSAGYFWVSKIMVSPNTGALRHGININRRADVGVWNGNVAAITVPVNGGRTGLVERQQFFHYVNFILGDNPEMPSDVTRQMEDQ